MSAVVEAEVVVVGYINCILASLELHVYPIEKLFEHGSFGVCLKY